MRDIVVEMDDDGDQTQFQKNANLARIRDNQRRSRARRKEYLSELEARWRICEQTGVEASAEIQTAARRVIEENKRLRLLLKDRGLTDAEIDGVHPATVPDDQQASTVAEDLEAMLGRPKLCGSKCGNDKNGDRKQSCAPSVPSQPALHMMLPSANDYPTLVAAPQAALRRSPPQLHTSQNHHRPSPHSASSTTSSDHLPPFHQNQNARTHSQYPTSYPQHQPQTYIPPLTTQQDITMSYPSLAPDSHLAWLNHYPTVDFMKSAAAQPHLQPTTSSSSTSCYAAADTIRLFKPDAGFELEEELGCNGDGRECEVDNGQMFGILDRYS